MTTNVRWFKAAPQFPEPWFVTDTQTNEVRYFNGRKFEVTRRMEHFVHMNRHDKDFTVRTMYVTTRTRQWHNETTRHSSTEFSEWAKGGVRR